jgi:hypothetical protein
MMTDFLHLPIAVGLETARSVGSKRAEVPAMARGSVAWNYLIDEIVTLGFATL